MRYLYYLIFLFGFSFFSQCKTADVSKTIEHKSSIDFGNGTKIVFLDSTQASVAIITDEIDHFFERITLTEMEIQMKSESIFVDRDEAVMSYKDFLSKDVESFNASEIENIIGAFSKIKSMLMAINPDLLNYDVQLIKTKGNHYGNSVFYTRENKIIIPENELQNFTESAFIEVMLHEYFHVFSRLERGTRNEIYKLIGFEEVNGIIILPEHLGKRKLLNPDGTTDYLVKLENVAGKKVYAYPLISSNSDHYSLDKPSFFEYLDFQLYELIPLEDQVFNLVVDEMGKSTIPFERIPSFFQTVKDNTNYIIHPDEIMADNFIYAVFYLSKGEKKKTFSVEGMKLIEAFGKILEEFKS